MDGSHQRQAASPGKSLPPWKVGCFKRGDGRLANAARWRQQDEWQGIAAVSVRHVPIPIEIVLAERVTVTGPGIPPYDGEIDITAVIKFEHLLRLPSRTVSRVRAGNPSRTERSMAGSEVPSTWSLMPRLTDGLSASSSIRAAS